MILLTPKNWQEYELIDSGNGKKLERFGKLILSRPEPQAVWNTSLSEEEWKKLADATFVKKKQLDSESEKGEWILKKGTPEQWFVHYTYKDLTLNLRLGFTSFKHIGIFPEQAENWDFIYDALSKIKHNKPRVLNLFAYTGAASLVAKAAGADVVHVDSVKQVVTWANENMEHSNLSGIRWIVEDAMKFIHREIRRGNKYDGIILDPPKYGRGADGERWLLEESINELIFCCSQLLQKKDSFFVLNLYSMGFSSLIADNLILSYFDTILAKEFGELFIQDQHNKRLPLGIFIRFKK